MGVVLERPGVCASVTSGTQSELGNDAVQLQGSWWAHFKAGELSDNAQLDGSHGLHLAVLLGAAEGVVGWLLLLPPAAGGLEGPRSGCCGGGSEWQ